MKLGPKQAAWVVEHAYPSGVRLLHIGWFTVIVPAKQPDPPFWKEGKLAPAPTLDPRWMK
jgi:hypothetical protein